MAIPKLNLGGNGNDANNVHTINSRSMMCDKVAAAVMSDKDPKVFCFRVPVSR